ncbi:MAG: hypothetical protein M3Q89_06875, partial [Verrucomicrobiota bacterium]|nr:hypothetical protein [Verrucomicrobiota bacterium]
MRSELPSLQFQPKFYTGEPERFHLPFCYDLAVLARPKLIVTLGLGDAQAHFTFCQAAREHWGGGRCVAVHRNGEAVEIAHDEKWKTAVADGHEWYGETTEFIAAGPEEAVPRFAESSVHLLLLNDCDSADRVRAVLAAWTPK